MSEPEAAPNLPAARVLWGRVATAAVVILLAFTLGRCGAEGVPEEDVARLEAQVADLQSTNDELEEQNGQLRTQVDRLRERASEREEAPAQPPAPESTAPAPGEGEPGGTHTVASGDTLFGIAIDVYGDQEMAQLIADANGLDTGATLQVGQVLQLPLDD